MFHELAVRSRPAANHQLKGRHLAGSWLESGQQSVIPGLYVLSIIVTGILAKIYQNWIHKFWEMFKIRLMMMKRKREFVNIKRSYEDLIQTLDENLIKLGNN